MSKLMKIVPAPGAVRITAPGGQTAEYLGPEDPGEEPPPTGDEPILDPNATLEIELNRSEGTAPCGVYITAVLTGANTYDTRTDPAFKWGFGDPGAFKHLDEDFFWRDRNVAWGPMTMHTYHPSPAEFAGAEHITKTITCEARWVDQDTRKVMRATASATFQVNNPDIVFAGADTICFSPTGDFAGAPAGATRVSTYNAAITAANGRAYARVLVQGDNGYLYDKTSWTKSRSSTNAVSHQLGTYPHGARALVHCPPGEGGTGWSRGFQFCDETAIWGFDLVNCFDPRDPYSITTKGDSGSGISIAFGNKNTNPALWDTALCHYTVYDNTFTGFDVAINPQDFACRLYCFDNRIYCWTNYGYFLGKAGDYIAFRGLSVKQPTGTWTGDGTKSEHTCPIIPDHGPGRNTAPPFRTVLQAIDICSRNSWGGGVADIQPSWRHAGRPVEHPYSLPGGETAYLATNCIRTNVAGGIFGFGAAIGEGNQEAEGVVWAAEMLYMVVWDGAQRPLGAKAPGQTVRNVAIVWADTPEDMSGRSTGQVTEYGEPDTFWPYVYESYPLRFYNMTICDRRSHYTGSLENGQIGWDYQGTAHLYSMLTRDNNVMYGPYWPNPGDAADPFDMTSIWSPRMGGHFRHETYPKKTYQAHFSDDDAPALRPMPGASAYGGANKAKFWAPHNIWGEWRDPNQVNRGAV